MPRSSASCTNSIASASLLPVPSPSRLNPPQPRPATLTLIPVPPSVLYSIQRYPRLLATLAPGAGCPAADRRVVRDQGRSWFASVKETERRGPAAARGVANPTQLSQTAGSRQRCRRGLHDH